MLGHSLSEGGYQGSFVPCGTLTDLAQQVVYLPLYWADVYHGI